MNCVNLIGRLTKDLELRQSQSGSASCRFTLAVDRIQRSDQQKETDFINCVAFGKTAENMNCYLRKGSKIGVQGRIQTGSYTNKQGQKVYTTDVMVDRVDFLDTKKDSGQQIGYQQPAQQFDYQYSQYNSFPNYSNQYSDYQQPYGDEEPYGKRH